MKQYYLYFTLKITRQQKKTACLKTLQLFLQATEHCNNILALLTMIFSPRNGDCVFCCWNSRLLINVLIYSCSRFTGKSSAVQQNSFGHAFAPSLVAQNRSWLCFLEQSLGLLRLVSMKSLSLTEHFRTELWGWSKTDNYVDYWLYTTDISMSYYTSVLLVYRRKLNITKVWFEVTNYFYTATEVSLMYQWSLPCIKLQLYESHKVCNIKVGLHHLSVLCLHLGFLIKTALITVFQQNLAVLLTGHLEGA